MNVADDSELIQELRDCAEVAHKTAGCENLTKLLIYAADRITELRMVRTMLYQRLNSLCDDNAELQRRVAELEAMA